MPMSAESPPPSAEPLIELERSPRFRGIGTSGGTDPSLAQAEPARRAVDVSRRLGFVCAFLVVVTLVTGAVVIWQLHQAALANAERELTNLGVVLAEQTSRTIQSVDLVLREVQSRTVTLGIRTPDQFRARMVEAGAHQFLVSRLRNLPQSDAIAVLDANGKLLDWTRDGGIPPSDFSDRDYFRWLSTHNDADAYISQPTRGRFTDKWLMFVARRINSPDGVFLGVVTGLIDTQYLEDFYQTISMVPGETVTVLRRDGVVIAGHPDISNRRGKHMPEQSPWYDRVVSGGGSYFSPGYLIDVPQIITVHPLRDYPLVVDVNVSVQAVLKSWYEQATVIAIAVAGVSVGCTILFAVIIGQFRRQEQQNARLRLGEAALRASERRLKAYAEMSADWFWERDARLNLLQDSNIPFTSMPIDVGEARWDLADPAVDPQRWDAHMADLAARRPFRDFRWEMLQNDGKRHFISISGDPFFDDAGHFLGYHGTARDVTIDVEAAEELRSAKDRAEAASRAKSQFLTNMSHELRTPLHAILGFSELIQVQAAGPIGAEYVHWARDILSGGRHLLNMINGVLDLSRIEAGRYDLLEETVDLARVARDCVDMIRLRAEAGQVQVDCTIEAAVIQADRQSVQQVLLNLLSNAVKFTPAGGVVRISAERAATDEISLIVADTGIGIDAATMASLGEPFTQADASTNRRYDGTGLGLTISRKLMTLHNGTLTIESAPGLGTTVRITFPASRVNQTSRYSVTSIHT
jgi:signal transduction histidine kinase